MLIEQDIHTKSEYHNNLTAAWFKTRLTGLVGMIIVNNIVATHLAIIMVAVIMETITTAVVVVVVVAAVDHLIGGTKNFTVLTLNCFIFCIFLLAYS